MAVNMCLANVEIMKKQVAELEDEKETVKHYIEDTSRSRPDQMELPKLNNWLTSAENLIKVAHELVNDVEENAKKKCLFCPCLDPKSPNQLSKQAEQNSKDIAEQVQEARRFKIPLSYSKEKTAVSGFQNFESRSGVLKEIMEALQSLNVNIIRVHGMPGVGKTMLVREVKRIAEQDKLFDVVVMATVGRNPDFLRIQDEIARGLGLVCVSNELTSQDQGASIRIKAWLTEKKALMILDDIWAPGLNLEELGIPLGGGQKQHGQEKKNKDSLSSKILLTSRDPDPLNLIGAEKNFAIEPLTEEEAWKQFKKMAVDTAESRSLPFYAEKIAKECKGLPISITTLAKTLKTRTLIEWKATLRKLQSHSQANLPEIPKGLHLAVELGYGGLKSKELQQTFLLCSLMGHNATIKDLLKYVIGLGLFPGVNSIEEARDEALTLVSKLRDSSLLLDGRSNIQFDMHDFIRIVAISIASQDHGLLASKEEDAPIEWQDNETIMEKFKWIYSSNFNAIGDQLPGELKCPQLTFLHLSNKNFSLAIPPNLFRETEGLKVLGLIKMHFLSTPSSISLLKNLNTLRLDQSVLESVDIGSILGELKSLQVLSLVGCDIQELPAEVGKLIRLKFLDLSDCTKLKVIPPGVLSSLSRLEELYLGNSFAQWDYSEDQQNRRNASFVELTQLKNLTTLEVSVCDIQMFQKVLFFTELKRYKIFIGDVWNYWDSSFENSKILKLKLDARIHFDYSVRELLKKTDELHLEVLNGVKDMVNELDDNGFQQLKYFHVKNYPEIQYLFIDSKKGIGGKIFPNLEVFVLHNLIKLEKIFHGQFVQTSFNKLRIIYVERCNQLKNLFSFSLAIQLLCLQEITVADCSNIVQIVDEEGQGSTNDVTEGTNVLELAQLQCLRLHRLPEFISFSHEDDTSSSFTSLFSKKVAFPNLEGMTISHLEVFVLYNSIKLENMFHGQFVQTSFKLRIINVEHCNHLKNLFSFSMAKQLPYLQEITVVDCSNIVEIVNEEGLIDITEGSDVLELAQLQCLRLQNLPEFISFSHKDDRSSRFTSLFNKKVAFPSLKRVTISHLENSMLWQELFENSFCNLKSLRVTYCQNMSTIFPSDNNMLRELLKSLEKLEIIGCSLVNEIKILSSIRILMLDSLDNLREILSQHSSSFLRTLEVRRCGSLTSLSTSKPASFTNVTTLDVQGCHLMTTLVSITTAQSLMQLVHMTVRECKNLTKIVGSDSLGREDSIVKFSKLRFLKLEYLSRLESFYSGKFKFKFPSLEKVVVDQCPKLKIFSEGDLHTPMLQRVEIIEIEDKWFWEGDLNTTIQSMYTEKVGFVGLKDLILQDFPKLMEIWHARSPQEILDFSRLECLELYDCNNFRYLLTPSMVFCLVQLQSVIVKGCVMLEQVIMGDGEESKMIFPQLWLIRLESCSDLTTFYVGSYSLEIPALANIIVNDCPKMFAFVASTLSEEASQYFFSSKVAFPRLQQLTIESMGSLNKIWNDQRDADSWCQLDTVIVDTCKRLLHIFQLGMLERLQKLEKLKIRNCDLLEEIFEYQELGTSQSHAQIITQPTLVETSTKFAFPKLTHLNLYKLPKLNCFCRQTHTTEWPSLKKLEVYGCGLQIFASEFLSFQGTNKNNQLEIMTQCPLFWVGKATFPKLKELKLKENKFMKEIWRGQNPGYYFPKLKVLELENLYEQSSAAIPPLFIQSLPDLEKLVVKNTSFNEIFPCQRLDIGADAPPQLTELRLFANLQTLEVFQCHGLKNLVKYSTTESLVQLRTMSIISCNMIEEIVVCDGDGVEEDIFFTKLKRLHLKDLPNLKCFCSGNCNFQFPSLQDVIVSDCLKLEIFTKGKVSTTKLQKVKFGENYERLQDGDLNTYLNQNHRRSRQSLIQRSYSGGFMWGWG